MFPVIVVAFGPGFKGDWRRCFGCRVAKKRVAAIVKALAYVIASVHITLSLPYGERKRRNRSMTTVRLHFAQNSCTKLTIT